MIIPIEVIIIILMVFILLLFIILLLHKGRHSKSNLFLVWYFITQIIALILSGVLNNNPICFIGGRFFMQIWGASFFFFMNSLLNADFKLKPIHILHLVPAFLLLSYLVTLDYPLSDQKLFNLFNNILNPMFNVSIIAYNIAAFLSYYQYKKRVKANGTFNKVVQEKWLNVVLFGFVFSCGIIQVLKFFDFYWNPFIIGNSIFLVYFSVLFYVTIVNQTYIKQNIAEKYKNSPLTEEEANRLLYMLDEFMHNNKPFTSQEVSLKGMAGQLKISERYLSQIINEYKKQNFSDYINFHRVQYSMELLKDPKYKDATILSVLFDSGFSSKTTFNAAFKKFAGCTPIEYKKKNMPN